MEELVALLDKVRGRRKISIILALGKLGGEEASLKLAELLENPDRLVRKRAAYALGRIGDAQSVAALVSGLNHEDYLTRIVVAEALSLMPPPHEVIPNVIKILKQEQKVSMRGMLVQILGNIRSAELTPLFLELLQSDVSNVRVSAADALGKIGSPSTVPELIKASQDRYEPLQRAAIAALIKIGSPEALKAVEDWEKRS